MSNPNHNKPLFRGRGQISSAGSKFMNRNRGFRGFTLIEVFIVIAIIGCLSAISIPTYLKYKYEAEVMVVITDIKMMEKQIALFVFDNDGQLPDRLNDLPNIGTIKDPWGNPYQYLKIDGAFGPPEIIVSAPEFNAVPGPGVKGGRPQINVSPPQIDIDDRGVIGAARKNMNEVPVNQDYDLYSMGKDGKTNVSFRAPVSFDDVVRAYEGRYVGLVSEL